LRSRFASCNLYALPENSGKNHNLQQEENDG